MYNKDKRQMSYEENKHKEEVLLFLIILKMRNKRMKIYHLV